MQNTSAISRQTIIVVTLITFLVGSYITLLTWQYDWQKAALGLTALLVGVFFFRSQFGFSYTWRVFIMYGDGRGLRAQMLWISIAALPFALLTGASDVFSAQAVANVRPLSVSVIVGAFLFGIGMQTGGACTSGSLVNAGQGGGFAITSLACFIIGALIAASHITFWTDLPAALPFSFYREWGLSGVLVIILLVGITAATTRLRRNTNETPLPTGRLPLWKAAIFLAILSVLLLFFGEQPWGIVYGLTILGGKTLLVMGFEEILFWDFWSSIGNGEELLHGSLFDGAQLTIIVGMLLGVAIAAAIANKFNPRPRLPDAKQLLMAALGGLLMGYGALISYGCNIGSYISALSSGSAHGCLWIVFAFIGAFVGVWLRRITAIDK